MANRNSNSINNNKRRVEEVVESDGVVVEIAGDKSEILNGKKELFKFVGFQKLLKEAKK